MQNRKPSELEVAWAAGLFEGEGCWHCSTRANGRKIVRASLGMTDFDVVDRFAEIVGCGNTFVQGLNPPAHRAHWKPSKTWAVHEAEQVRRLIELFLPYMGERRREKALAVLDLALQIRPHYAKNTHCPKGHPFTADNVRMERIYKNGKTYMARRCRTCRVAEERARARRRRQRSIPTQMQLVEG